MRVSNIVNAIQIQVGYLEFRDVHGGPDMTTLPSLVSALNNARFFGRSQLLVVATPQVFFDEDSPSGNALYRALGDYLTHVLVGMQLEDEQLKFEMFNLLDSTVRVDITSAQKEQA